MSMTLVSIFGIVCAVAALVALYIFVLPESKREDLHPVLRWLHDTLKLKNLMLESIMRFLYMFLTVLCLTYGFWMLFGKIGTGRYSQSTAIFGLITMIGGPIVVRLLFELFMIRILMLKNVIDINKKLGGQNVPSESARASRPARPQYQPRYVRCPECGRRYDANKGGCPTGCGSEEED